MLLKLYLRKIKVICLNERKIVAYYYDTFIRPFILKAGKYILPGLSACNVFRVQYKIMNQTELVDYRPFQCQYKYLRKHI